ncbi:MAG: MFS transporter [Thermincola sp.]|jgi:MFS family permease|nr:MFS transporter [Thermincola sp.]MDT3703539.1 MFS transporter [Thermincola sp.]
MTEMPTVSTSLYKNRLVRAITISMIFLQIGIWVRNFAILLFVVEKTNNNPYAVSMISVIEFAPIFVFSFIGGTFADRWRPKLTMVCCDALSAISVFGVLLAIMFGGWEAVFFVTLVSAITSQFSQPSAMKLYKHHVPGEQLQAGIAVFQTVMAIFTILGPLMGTFIYQKFGINVAIGIVGVAFLMSAVTLLSLPPDRKSKGKREQNFMLELAAGFRYVWNRKVLALLGGVFLVAGSGLGIIVPLGVFLVTERLGLPKESLQWLMATNGVAMLIGGGVVMGFARRFSPQKFLAVGLLVSSLTIVGMGLSTILWVTLALQFISGLFLPSIHVAINTLILQSAEEEFVGRVNGVLNPLFVGGMVTAMSVVGWLKTQLNLEIVYGISGLLFFTGVVLSIPIARAFSEQQQETKLVLENGELPD